MEPVIELKYALDTFYFLVMGAFCNVNGLWIRDARSGLGAWKEYS